jgi:multiple sugar transport system ATP-binding protein
MVVKLRNLDMFKLCLPIVQQLINLSRMAELVLKNLTKKFGDKTVLSDFNLSVNSGEFVVLVGPSGSGKSTILRLISGLEKASSGEIWIEGKLVNEVPPKDRDVAMVFQNYALYPHMTIFGNIAFPLKLRKISKTEIEDRVEEVAALLGLKELLRRKPATLSGGQRQRVALGRAIIRRPKIFLFDEPLSNLDAQLRTSLRGELLRLQRQLKTTSVYVTHDQLEALTLGDKVVVLKDGISQQEGSPNQLYHRPANRFVAEFIGSPGMNFIAGEISDQGEFISSDLRFSTAGSPGKAHTGKAVILGIRPEDLQVSQNQQPEGTSATLEYVEPAGGESYLYFNLGKTRMVAKHVGEGGFKPGLLIGVKFKPDRLHWFDQETGKRIE